MPGAQLLGYVPPTSPKHEDAFNRWYDEIHIPQAVERARVWSAATAVG
ncbi:hypothetical protein LWC35_19655 [Pseudonocardia kujensis]|nr:hypothetical protein [Pseudonocardia kujensis]MCE0765097.1 hypothetical protein [Pseudonocardia kujensis]